MARGTSIIGFVFPEPIIDNQMDRVSSSDMSPDEWNLIEEFESRHAVSNFILFPLYRKFRNVDGKPNVAVSHLLSYFCPSLCSLCSLFARIVVISARLWFRES